MSSWTNAARKFIFGAPTAPNESIRVYSLTTDGAIINTNTVRLLDQVGVGVAVQAGWSGRTIVIAAQTVGGLTFTLPAAAVGLNYKFVCGTTAGAGSTSVAVGQVISFTAPAARLFGPVNSGVTGAISCLTNPGQTTISMPAAALTGDWFQCFCDGTNWQVTGQISVAGPWTHA